MALGSYGEGNYGTYQYGVNQLVLSSSFDYGKGLYGRNDYGDDVLTAVVTATSSVTSAATKVHLAGALVASASSITTIGEEVHLGSATVSATATLTALAIISVVGAGAMTSTATIVGAGTRVRLAGALSENAAKMGQTLVSAISTGYQVSGSTAQPTTTTGLTSGSLFGAGKR